MSAVGKANSAARRTAFSLASAGFAQGAAAPLADGNLLLACEAFDVGHLIVGEQDLEELTHAVSRAVSLLGHAT